jgi:hypothetical protein
VALRTLYCAGGSLATLLVTSRLAEEGDTSQNGKVLQELKMAAGQTPASGLSGCASLFADSRWYRLADIRITASCVQSNKKKGGNKIKT